MIDIFGGERMAEYKVVEKFVSINGEGTRAGQLAVFIRFQGCNLNCSYCDTTWANQSETVYEWMTEEEIVSYILKENVYNVTLTGGEPLLQKGIEVLLERLAQEKQLWVEIETNGSVDLKPFVSLKNKPSITMDYKLPSSGMEQFMCEENFFLLQEKDTVKFVSGSRADLDKARKMIEQYELTKRCHVYLSPVFGNLEPAQMVAYMKEHNMNGVNLQLQMHKFIWNPNQKGV